MLPCSIILCAEEGETAFIDQRDVAAGKNINFIVYFRPALIKPKFSHKIIIIRTTTKNCTQCAHTCVRGDGTCPNGISPTVLSPNRTCPNGICPNGFCPNGICPNN